MRIKTSKQFQYDSGRCIYCKGLGYDIFDHSLPCPHCSKDVAVILKNNELTKEEVEREIDLKINLEISRGECAYY